APRLAVGGEDAVEADLGGDRRHAPRAQEAVGPVAQHLADRLGVGDDQHLAVDVAEAVVIAVSGAPLFERQVHGRAAQAQEIADHRQARWRGQVAQAAAGRHGAFSAPIALAMSRRCTVRSWYSTPSTVRNKSAPRSKRPW